MKCALGLVRNLDDVKFLIGIDSLSIRDEYFI